MRVILTIDGHSKFYEFVKPVLTIGRNFHGSNIVNDIPIQADQMSRRHARITLDGDLVYIEDLGSRNGTFLNGQRLQANTPWAIPFGGTVSFGSNSNVILTIDKSVQGIISHVSNAEVLAKNLKILSRFESGVPLDKGVKDDNLVYIKFKFDSNGIISFDKPYQDFSLFNGNFGIDADSQLIHQPNLFLEGHAPERAKANVRVAITAFNSEIELKNQEKPKELIIKNLNLMNSTKSKGMKYFLKKSSSGERSKKNVFFWFDGATGEILEFTEKTEPDQKMYPWAAIATGLFSFNSELKIHLKQYFGRYSKQARAILRNSVAKFNSQPDRVRKKLGMFW